jgi:hypothetical protein
VKRNPKSQSLVEFALVLPIILLLVVGILELTRLMIAWFGVQNAARAGIDYAISGEYNPIYCRDIGCSIAEEKERAIIRSIHDAVRAGATMIYPAQEGEVERDQPDFFRILVCPTISLGYPDQGIEFDTYHCYPDENLGMMGARISIIVEFNHPLILPVLNPSFPFLRISARRETKL